MKTLIIEGSARKKGHTAELVQFMKEHLSGEVEVIRCYEQTVRPCIDCRYCLKHPACSQKDEDMAHIYSAIDNCDNIVIASPMYFYSVPGPMKCVIDRLQVYWASHVRKDRERYRCKKGALVLVGGAPTVENQFTAAQISLNGLLRDLNASCEAVVTMNNTDRESLADNKGVQAELKALAETLCQTDA